MTVDVSVSFAVTGERLVRFIDIDSETVDDSLPLPELGKAGDVVAWFVV